MGSSLWSWYQQKYYKAILVYDTNAWYSYWPGQYIRKIPTIDIGIYWYQVLTRWRRWCWAHWSGWGWGWKLGPIKKWRWKRSWLSIGSIGVPSQSGGQNHSTNRQSIIGSLGRTPHQNITNAWNHNTPYPGIHANRMPKVIYPARQDLNMPSLWPSLNITEHSIRMHIYSLCRCKRDGQTS